MIIPLLVFLVCVCFVDQNGAGDQPSVIFRPIRIVDNSSLPSESASVQAFDISPDGSLLALLFQPSSPRDTWFRAVIEDVATGNTRVNIVLSPAGNRPDFQNFPWYEPHVVFSPDQRFLTIQDWQSVQVLDIAESRIVRRFTSTNEQMSFPLSIHSTSSNSLVLVSYGTKAPFIWSNKGFNDLVNPQRVHNELVDISTGQRRSSWESADIPQSLSANGELAAVSDWEGSTAQVEIQIVDAQTGQKLKTLNSGFKFRKPWAPGAAGRIVGKFLGDEEILLSPDEHTDSEGHHSGESLKIMRVSDGQLVREIKFKDFGPLGEMVVSADAQSFAIVNWHISPGAAKRDAAPPGSPSLIVFPNRTNDKSYAIFQLQSRSGLRTIQWRDTWLPRIANNAAVVAVVQGAGVAVFQKN